MIVRLLESNTVTVSPVLPVAICLIVAENNLQRTAGRTTNPLHKFRKAVQCIIILF